MSQIDVEVFQVKILKKYSILVFSLRREALPEENRGSLLVDLHKDCVGNRGAIEVMSELNNGTLLVLPSSEKAGFWHSI